nr:MAG TPA: hypothetical protein [Caudoviricetes sp.]
MTERHDVVRVDTDNSERACRRARNGRNRR